jgi:Xaa-Pro aminopeptidase
MRVTSFVPDPPVLTNAERDRRWGLLRDMMRRNGVDCLLIPAAPHRYPADIYFTNSLPGCTVIFPLKSEPVAFHRGASVAGSWLQARDWGESNWIDDMRFGPNLIPFGWMPHLMWNSLTEALPEVEWVELWDDFAAIWLTKSAEEVALYRYVSMVCEKACEVMLEMTRPGVAESEIYAEMMKVYYRHCATPAHDLFIHSGVDNLSWDAPRWLHRAQKPRIIQEGDVVMSEIMAVVGGIEGQAQMCIGVGAVAHPFLRAAEVARESYEAAIATIRAGVTFGEVADAMQAPLRKAGAWHLTPHIHSVTPLTLLGPVTEDLDDSIASAFKQVHQLGGTCLDVLLEPGMAIQLEPNAAFGRQQVNIGGNVLVTETGCEELNSLPNYMRFVD